MTFAESGGQASPCAAQAPTAEHGLRGSDAPGPKPLSAFVDLPAPATIAFQPAMTTLYADWALLPQGWSAKVRVGIGADGRITRVETDTPAQPGDQRLEGRALLPALANLHSHSFQRVIAGRTERRGGHGVDSFWSWREQMYRALDRLDADDQQAIAAYVFMRMLESGYASVAEFHYLHHAHAGRRHPRREETSLRMLAAAADTGIGLCLLPVLYERGGLDERAADAYQQRFICTVDDYLRLLDDCASALRNAAPDYGLGVAPHSLRAVRADSLRTILAAHPTGPVHLHIAEQTAEVEQMIAAYGARPVRWLLDRFAVDARWCLVHATHLDDQELVEFARSGAVAGLTPITEANLGDGVFRAEEFLRHGGSFGIGSDSNVQIGLSDELRLLEYGQRLYTRRRAVLASPSSGASTAESLFAHACAGGAKALGRQSGKIACGAWADLLTLDVGRPECDSQSPLDWLDSWIFSGSDQWLADVWSAGRHCVTQGRHRAREAISERYTRTIQRLKG